MRAYVDARNWGTPDLTWEDEEEAAQREAVHIEALGHSGGAYEVHEAAGDGSRLACKAPQCSAHRGEWRRVMVASRIRADHTEEDSARSGGGLEEQPCRVVAWGLLSWRVSGWPLRH